MYDNKQQSSAQTRIVVSNPNQPVSYGMATSFDLGTDFVTHLESINLSANINFYLTEYLMGFMFVVLSSVYIFAVPKVLTQQSRIGLTLTMFFKRSIDLIAAIIGLIFAIPVGILIAIIIKLESRGPVFYTQERVGLNRRKRDRRTYQKSDIENRREDDRRNKSFPGIPFKVYKFRTMVDKAEKESGPVWATKNDPRITRFGKFLRKTRLDEIPQFINVLKGEMSLVGPRPERPEFVEELSGQVENYMKRLNIKPGLTGLAQVSNGYDDSIESVKQKVKYDLEYINNLSIWLDIKILFRTVWVVLTGKGAQ